MSCEYSDEGTYIQNILNSFPSIRKRTSLEITARIARCNYQKLHFICVCQVTYLTWGETIGNENFEVNSFVN